MDQINILSVDMFFYVPYQQTHDLNLDFTLRVANDVRYFRQLAVGSPVLSD